MATTTTTTLAKPTTTTTTTTAAPDSVSTNPESLSYDQSEAQYVAVNSSDSWTAAVYHDTKSIISSVTGSGTTGERCYITVDSQESFASATIRVTCGTAYADVSILLSQ